MSSWKIHSGRGSPPPPSISTPEPPSYASQYPSSTSSDLGVSTLYGQTPRSSTSAVLLGSPGTSTVTIPDVSLRNSSTPLLPRFVHYRIYSDSEAVETKALEFSEDPCLGRVLATRIPPPHSAANVKRYLCKKEGIAIDENTQATLFADLSCLAAMENSELVDIMNPEGIASASGNPLAIVISEVPRPSISHLQTNTSRQHESPVSTTSLPDIHDFSRPNDILPMKPQYKYTLRTTSSLHANHHGYLSYELGEILHTDGKVTRISPSGWFHAQRCTGEHGVIWITKAEFVGTFPPDLNVVDGRVIL